MPKNVMKLLKRSVSVNLNDFDLSHRHLVGLNFGALKPLTFIETVPGDYIELSVSDLLRAIPMVTSPFLRANQHIEVWFTPYHDLWQGFESFISQKEEPAHANIRVPKPTFVPHASTGWMRAAAYNFQSSSDIDVVGRPWLQGFTDLWDMCGYGLHTPYSVQPQTSPEVNLFRVMQYNKVWYEEYRQKYYDNGLYYLQDSDFVSGYANPAVIWNADDLLCSSAASSNMFINTGTVTLNNGTAAKRFKEMFQQRYRCWKKDLFTGVLPSTQFGNVSVVDSNDFGNLIYIRSKATGVATNQTVGILNNDYLAANQASTNVRDWKLEGVGGSIVNAQFDVLALRKSEAIQMWRQNALTAGNRISDNMKAHYGDDAEYNDHRSTFLGSVSAPLNIMDINATAQTGSGANQGLGDVAGKGLSSLDQKVFKFKAHQFGSIMVLFSLLPEAEYESRGIDRMNQLLESEDFFVKEYQDLGLEAVGYQNFYSSGAATSILGYAPRYYGYKQKLDKCFNGFWTGGDFAAWASPKTDVTTLLGGLSSGIPLSLLYVNPKLYDNNFSAALDSATDYQFIGDFFFNCSAKRNMSVSGLPNLS